MNTGASLPEIVQLCYPIYSPVWKDQLERASIPYVSLEPAVSIIGGFRRSFRPPISHHNGHYHLVIITVSDAPF